ncbi:MAG: hypothetical protein A2X86_15825 [Bdellovibrionales bacterium GWA2_49_15]|nr:MAG: hypothetical protein A2X86_15825 [Bdellovibrionales bacterium GWA2_49_15]HAZ12405.1 hypothetical protein [Bdellovibrionales bacterium]
MSKKKLPGFLEKLKGIFSRKKKELPTTDIPVSEGPSELDSTLSDGPQFESEDEPDFTIKELKLSDLKAQAAPPDLPSDVLPFPTSKIKESATPEEEYSLTDVPPVPEPPTELTEQESGNTLSSQDKTNKDIDLSKLQFVSDLDDHDLRDATSPDALQTMRVNLPQFEGNQVAPKWKRYKDKVVKSLQTFFNKSQHYLLTQIEKYGKTFNLQKKDLTWDQVISTIFSPQSRRPVHHFFIVASFLAATYSIGKIAAYLIKGPEKKIKMHSARVYTPPDARPFDLGPIRDANIFNVKRTPTESIKLGDKKDGGEEAKVCLQANRPSSLPLKLINTVVLQDSIKSMASVAVRGANTPTEVREGDKLETMASIGKIERLRVIFKNLKSNDCEFIDNMDERINSASPITYVDPQSGKKLLDAARPKEIRNEGNKFVIKKTYRDQILQDVGNILSQARAVQLKNPDGTLSFKMTEVVPGSIYSHLNITDGDVIHHINGREITNLNDVMNMFGRIKDLDHLSISINRGGSDVELEYDFD